MNKLFKDRKFLTIGAFLLLLIVAGIFRLLNRSNDLGFSVVSDFQKQLSAPMTADQTYIPLTNLMLTGETDTTCAAGSRCLDVATMGDEIFVTIDAGTSKVELIRCTASSSSTNRFTGCTRGLEFSGTSLSSVTGLAQTHRQGATVTVSNVHYIYEKFLDLTGKSGTVQTLTGDFTATGTMIFSTSTLYVGNNASTQNKCLSARNGDAAYPFLCYNETLNRWQFSDNGVDTVTFVTSSAAGLSASSTQGIGITNSEIHVNASSTASTNGGFLDFSSAGRLFWDVASFLSGTWSWTGVNTFTAGFGRLFVPTPTDDGEAVNKLYTDTLVTTHVSTTLLSRGFGDGSDGALDIQSSTTTLNTSGKNVYQYSSVTIGGTGVLTTGANLAGKAVYILVQGDLTVTSTATPAAINLKGQGGQGGAGGTAAVLSNFRITQTASVPGTAGTTGGGGGGGSGINNNGSTGSPGVSGGAGGAGGSKEVYDALYAVSKLVSLCPMGQGGSGGGSAQAAGGAGGAGGGCIIFLVGGNINLSSTLIATGVDGTAGSNGIPEYGAGGGGGGGGGFIGIFYAGSETANTATFTVSAGSAGGGGTGTTNNGGAGGAGGAGQYTTRAIKVVNIPF